MSKKKKGTCGKKRICGGKEDMWDGNGKKTCGKIKIACAVSLRAGCGIYFKDKVTRITQKRPTKKNAIGRA